jgi:hypothetical protein
VNHTTTIGIAVVIVALSVVFTPGIYAVTAVYAGGGGHGDGDGDSISIKSKFKQKNICWAVDDSRTTCRNDASVFGSNEKNRGGVTPTPISTTIQVSGQGEGENFCPRATGSLPASISFSVQQNAGGAVQGQFNVDVRFPALPFTKTGTLDSVQITGNSFTITGKELSAGNQISRCEDILVPPTATITGQCGTDVTIRFETADGEHATFTGNVECTTTS